MHHIMELYNKLILIPIKNHEKTSAVWFGKKPGRPKGDVRVAIGAPANNLSKWLSTFRDF